MQTELYSEILNKMGIDVFGQEIIAIAYEMVASGNQQTETATSFEIKNYSVFEYNDQHYYATVDRFGNVRSNSQAQAIRDAARQSFRATEQIAEEKIEEESKTNPFALIDANTRKAMILKLIEVVKENMAGVSKQYDEINKNLVMDPNTKNIEKSKLDRRKASLTSILSRLEVETFGEQPAEVALAQAIVMKTALDVLSKEIEVITSEVNALDIPQIYELGSEANKTILSTLHNYMVNLDAMQNYIEGFKNTVVSSPGLTEDQIKDLGAYFDNISRLMLAPEVKSYELSKNVTKAILKKIMGSSNNELGSKFAKVFGDVKKVLGPRLDWINRTIAEIEQGKTTNNTLSYRVMRSLGNLFSSDKNQTDRLTALKEEAKKISKLMEINELTDEVLDDYLTALIDNRESAFYMGQTMKGGDFNVVQISDIIGSSADSEMIVSAMFQYMRNISEQARIEALRWADELDIDNLKSAFIASMGGIQAANRAISEEVEVPLEFDINGDVTSSQMERKFLGPVSQEFKNIHMRYRDKQRKYSEQVKEMMKQVRDEANAERKETLKKELKQLEDEAQAHNREYTEWRIENEETDIKPDVLRLMHASGAANDMISNIYMQMQQILFAAGGEENLTEDQQDQIDALHADVSRIRAEAIEADPTIKEKLDQLTEYFEYDPNFVLWTIRREGIQKEGNAKKLQTWDNNNTDRVPTEEFNNRIDRLYEAIANIKGEMDSQLAALYAERRLIKSKAKVRGVFNFNYLTNEDIARYNEVENAIQARLEELKEDNEMLEEEDRRRYAQLMSELKGIRIQVLDPRYKQKYDMLRKNVKTAYNLVASLEKEKAANYADRSIDAKIADAKQQYERKEQEFKAFFDQHNKTKYELGQNLIGENKAFKEQPNAYLFVYMPKDPNDMELVPNNKYRIKRLKQSAYNEKYQASFEMQENSSRFYAMPKGIRFNYATNEFEISSNAKWANPRFVEMQKNKTANEFYKKWVIENFILKQRDAVGRPLGFNYPFVQQLGLENVISKGMKGVAREYQEKLQEVTYNTSELEKATNESGLTGQQKVVFKENYKVAADLTTTNGIESIVNWNAGFYANKKMAMLGLEMSSVLTFLKNIEKNITGKTQEETDGRKRMIKTIIDQIEYNKNKFVYGQIFEKRIDGESNAIFNRKTMRIMMQVASFGRMAFDIPMQFGNLLSGNVQAFLSTSSSRHATQMNYINAKRLLYTRWMPRLLADWGKISGASFETKLFRYMNPLSKNLDRMFEANTVSKMRRLANRVFNVGDMSMALQDKGEVEIGLTVMLMVLDNRRYEVFETDSQGNIVIENGVKKLKKDANGSQVYVNGIEAFGLNEQNTIAPKNNVNISEQEIDDLRSLIMGEIYTFQGNYATYTKSKFGSTKLGTLYEFYRKYLIPAVGARFRIGGHEGIGSMYSWDTGEAYTGWYVALGKMFKYYGWQKASATLLYDTLVPGMIKNRMNINTGIEAGDYYRMRSAMAGREILLAVLFYMLYQALRSALYDGDEDDYNYLELSMMRTLVKVSNESRSMVPMIIVGKPGDYIDNFGSLTSAFREGKTVWDLGTNGFWYVDYQLTGSTHAFERGFYQRDTDRFEEGDAKVTKNFYDLTGISNIIDTYYPYEAAKRQLKQK
jgi:hypothetical protein